MSKAIRAGSCTTCLGSLYALSAEAAINSAIQGMADHNTVVPDVVGIKCSMTSFTKRNV
jgi:hypothetical protein